MKNVTRIIALVLLLSVFAITLTGCGDDGRTVINVYNWGEYIDPSVIDIFEEENPDIKVNYDMFEATEDCYAKIANTKTAYDVIVPSDYIVGRMIEEGLLAKLDFNNIPNFELIKDEYKNLDYDPTNEYSVPYMSGTLGILYNKTMVDEAKEDIDWGILFDEKYKGKIFMWDSMRDSFCVALKYLGYSCNTTNEAEITEAKEVLIKQKDLVLAYVGDYGKNKMVAGEGALWVTYAGDAMTAMGENSDLDFVIPVSGSGSNFFVDAMCVPASSEHKAEAERFINFMTRSDIAQKNVEYILYSPVNREVAENLPEELKNSPIMNPQAQVLEKCESFNFLGEETTKFLDKAWTEIKSA